LAPVGQTLPHAPQLVALVLRSTQALPHIVSGVQTIRHRPAEQNSPAAHALPQAPQFARSEATSTQAAPQAVRPAGHAHRPPVQT
jgi:hypothetical protein